MRDKQILRDAGVNQQRVAKTLGVDPSTLTKRFNKEGEEGGVFSRSEWMLILENIQKESQPLSGTLRGILVQEGRLEPEYSPAAHVRPRNKVLPSLLDGINLIDLCEQLATAGIKTLSVEDVIYLSSAWRTIGGALDIQLTIQLLEHRNKQS